MTIAGGFSFGASGGVAGQLALNDGVNFVGTNIVGGTYIVDTTGRVTLQGVNVSPVIPSMGPFSFQLYLDGNGNALELGVDATQITEGLSYLQTAASSDFEGTYAIAGQGYLPGTSTVIPWGAVGPVTVSSDTFNGFTDYTAQGTTPAADVSLTGTENNSTGVLSLAGLNAVSFSTAYSYGYFPIDSRRVLALEVDGQQLGLLLLEGVSH